MLESQSHALCGIDSSTATRVLSSLMTMCTWQYLFFSIILRLRGEACLASLLGDGGALNTFEWCRQWRQGISSIQHNVKEDLDEATVKLAEAEREMRMLANQYRACPGCRGLFGAINRSLSLILSLSSPILILNIFYIIYKQVWMSKIVGSLHVGGMLTE